MDNKKFDKVLFVYDSGNWNSYMNLSSNKNAKFGGFFTLNGADFYIEKVVYNNPATIVFWSDNTTTVCKCSKEDIYSKETGLTICILKKLIGAKNVRKIFNDWLPELDKSIVTLKDVRHKNK